MENGKEKSQQEMVKEAVEEAKKKAGQECAAEEAESEEEAAKKEPENAAEPEDADSEGCSSDEECGDEDGEQTDTEAGTDGGRASGRKLFGKKNKKDKKDEKIEELTDKLTRQMAEFDNFRKRTDREKSQMYEIGAKDIIDKILPVVDNFERGLGAVKEDQKDDPFVQGMEMVYKQLMTTLEGVGVTSIEAAGKEFNPDFHNAVMHVEDETRGENVVAEELQKGYMYRDSVVRHSMVKVAN